MNCNILYGALTGGEVAASDGYWKKSCLVPLSDSAVALVRSLVPESLKDDGRLGLYASVLCAFSGDTVFGDEIRKLDPCNTYVYPKYGGMTLHDVTAGIDLAAVVRALDMDISERLVVPQWIDVMSAGCLQVLRGML